MNKDATDKVIRQVVADVGGAFSAGLGYIGDRLGLFRALAASGPCSSRALARTIDLDERYVREWLKAMVSANYVEYDAQEQEYSMTPEQVAVLVQEDSPVFAAGAFQFALPSLLLTPRLIERFEDGGGISYSELDPEIFEAIDRMHRPWFEHRLTTGWLPAVPRVDERLLSGTTVLDVGCGLGRASLAVARAYPNSRVLGIDPHEDSIARARRLASDSGLKNVDFRVVRLEEIANSEAYGLILAIDCIHDMPDPIGALRGIRTLLAPAEGLLFWSEPTGSHNPLENRNPVGKMRATLSPFHCLTVSLAAGGAGLGTIIGEKGARDLADEAGFEYFEKLPIENAMQQFYLLGVGPPAPG